VFQVILVTIKRRCKLICWTHTNILSNVRL